MKSELHSQDMELVCWVIVLPVYKQQKQHQTNTKCPVSHCYTKRLIDNILEATWIILFGSDAKKYKILIGALRKKQDS